MTKSELKTGMVVTLRNGEKYIVLLNTEIAHWRNNGDDYIVHVDGKSYISLDDYNEGMVMINQFNKDFDIMKVEKHTLIHELLYANGSMKTIWERKEKKTYTYAQLREILGEEFEVIG